MRFSLLIYICLSTITWNSICQDNWSVVSHPGINLDVPGLFTAYSFYNETVGSHGSRYYLKKSTDMQSFSTILTRTGDFGCYSINSIYFINSDTGFFTELCQGLVAFYRTRNGGETWESVSGGGTYDMSMFFRSDTLGYYTFFPGEPNSNYLMRFEGNSATMLMETKKYIFADYGYLAQLYFLNDSTGFLGCLDSLGNSVILKTSNYGNDWTEVYSSTSFLIRDIAFSNDSCGLVIGTGSTALWTTDQGITWNPIGISCNCDLWSIAFSDDGYGYLTGDEGWLFHSDDGGDTWAQETFPGNNDLVRTWVFPDDHAYILDNTGTLYSNFPLPGINEFSVAGAWFSPNPSRNNITIHVNGNSHGLTTVIYDLSGRILMQVQDTRTISLTGLKQGTYIIEIRTDDRMVRTRLIRM